MILLVDEYDKPILDHIANLEIAEKNRLMLKNLFDVIKGLGSCFRAIFITGVSKFSKVSIFSGLNNLNDISEDPSSATLLGYTEQELEKYFTPYIDRVAKKFKVDRANILQDMKDWYNGYRFSDQNMSVYTPISVLYFLAKQELRNYWFTSGTPSFLVELLRKRYQNVGDIVGKTLNIDDLGPFEINNIPFIPVLYQTGYLTIRDAFRIDKKLMFTLDYPNAEVKESLTKYLYSGIYVSHDGYFLGLRGLNAP